MTKTIEFVAIDVAEKLIKSVPADNFPIPNVDEIVVIGANEEYEVASIRHLYAEGMDDIKVSVMLRRLV